MLLYRIMEDNPKLSTLYTTGIFFFILMYTGSNVLPIGRFLGMTHDKQAFRSDKEGNSDRMTRFECGGACIQEFNFFRIYLVLIKPFRTFSEAEKNYNC